MAEGTDYEGPLSGPAHRGPIGSLSAKDVAILEYEFGPASREELEYYISEHIVAGEQPLHKQSAIRWGISRFKTVEGEPYRRIRAARDQLIGVDISVSGVQPLAKSFETLSARAHKELIPNVLTSSVNRLNRAIVKNIPVGPRGHRGDTGGWRRAQSQIRAHDVAGGGRHTTTSAAALPTNQALGIEDRHDYYPFDVEYGSRFQAAFAPIRRAVDALEKSTFGEILDVMTHGLAVLAIPIGAGLLLRKAIYGRAIPKDLMPIDWSRSRPGDIL